MVDTKISTRFNVDDVDVNDIVERIGTISSST